MPINCLIKFWTVMFKKSIHGQFVNNSWTFMFQKDDPFAFRLLSLPLFSSFFLSLPLFLSLSLCLFVSLSLCLFLFLSLCLFVSLSPPLLLSLPLSSSFFLFLPLLLSFFNVHPANPANSLKNKDLRKRHFWLQIFESREAAKTQNVRRKIRPLFFSLPRRPYTPHTAQNWPYILRRETLHHVRFYVGFSDPILHT